MICAVRGVLIRCPLRSCSLSCPLRQRHEVQLRIRVHSNIFRYGATDCTPMSFLPAATRVLADHQVGIRPGFPYRDQRGREIETTVHRDTCAGDDDPRRGASLPWRCRRPARLRVSHDACGTDRDGGVGPEDSDGRRAGQASAPTAAGIMICANRFDDKRKPRAVDDGRKLGQKRRGGF